MTEVVGEMIALAPSVPSVTVGPFLAEEDGGKRLFAYAHIYPRPEAGVLPELVRCVTEKEDTPFGQYWGIQASVESFNPHLTASIHKSRAPYKLYSPS